MVYLLLSLIIFFASVLLHIILHRLLAKRKILTMKTLIIFLPGLLAIIYFCLSIHYLSDKSLLYMPIPLSGIILYILMTSLLAVFYTHPALNYVSPSTLLLRMLEKKKMTYRELRSNFTDKTLIDNRIDSLLQNGLIKKEKNKYFACPKGIKINAFMENYRKLFGWSKE